MYEVLGSYMKPQNHAKVGQNAGRPDPPANPTAAEKEVWKQMFDKLRVGVDLGVGGDCSDCGDNSVPSALSATTRVTLQK